MKRYLIGIDNGSQSTKVSVFDEHGVVVCEGRQALRPNDTPRPGVVEHPDDDIWYSIGEASRRAMAAFPAIHRYRRGRPVHHPFLSGTAQG